MDLYTQWGFTSNCRQFSSSSRTSSILLPLLRLLSKRKSMGAREVITTPIPL